MKILDGKKRPRYSHIEGEPDRKRVECPVCGLKQAAELDKCVKCGADLREPKGRSRYRPYA